MKCHRLNHAVLLAEPEPVTVEKSKKEAMNATTSPRNRGTYYIASYTENQSRPLCRRYRYFGMLLCICAYLLGSRLACALNRAAVLRALGRSCVHPAERSMHLDKWIN